MMKSFLLIALLSMAMPLGGASAQSLDFVGKDGNDPIAIDAKGGIEWDQNAQLFVAKGPATATRGDMVLNADELRAYYRPAKDGSSEVYRLDAIGNVRITSPGRVATGGRAVYDVDKAVVVLDQGSPVTLTAGADIITADGQLEFWDARNLAVVRDGATAVRADKRIRANVMTAHFTTNSAGKSEVGRLEAFDNVVITTSNETAYADRAAYNVPTGLARLTGSVKIKRGDNEINGCSADIDLNTGVSRMNSCEGSGNAAPDQKTGGPIGAPRVHGVLAPTK